MKEEKTKYPFTYAYWVTFLFKPTFQGHIHFDNISSQILFKKLQLCLK